jgi:TPR repeat protein
MPEEIETGMSLHRTRCRQTSSRTAGILFAAAAAVTLGCNSGAGEARELDAACANGDAAACNRLGYKLREGEHVLADWRRAADLFGQACDGGEGEGCVRLARMQLDERGEDRGVTGDSRTATTLLEQACEGGALIGCIELADMYLKYRSPDAAGADID